MKFILFSLLVGLVQAQGLFDATRLQKGSFRCRTLVKGEDEGVIGAVVEAVTKQDFAPVFGGAGVR